MRVNEARLRPIRLVIAERRPIVLQGFASLLAAERDFAIVASCLDGAACLEAIRKLKPDVALVEDGFPDVTASEMLAAVDAENIPTRLVFYTASVARGDLAAAVAAGACSAIPMREKPDTVLHSLRLVAPADDAASGRRERGVLGENGLPALTDQERRIMRLVASGMSDREIARQLEVSPRIVTAQLDRISAQHAINSRTDLATFSLSRLYGSIGALAALILAALDDARADTDSSGDTFTVMTENGTAEAVAITISPKKSAPAKPAKAAVKVGREENSFSEGPSRTIKPVEPGLDMPASMIGSTAHNFSRSVMSGQAAFMLTAVGVWIYELLNSVAHAFNPGDSLAPADASDAAGDNRSLASPVVTRGTDAKFDGVDNLAWLNPEASHHSFTFDGGRTDAHAIRGDEDRFIDATAATDSVDGSGGTHPSSGAIVAAVDHGGFEQSSAVGEFGDANRETVQTASGDEPNRGQSRRDAHAAEQGDASDPRPENGPPDNYGQSQRELHASTAATAPGEQRSQQDSPGHGSSHAPSHRGNAPGDAAAGREHAKHGPPEGTHDHGHAQRELLAPEAGAASSKHSEQTQSGNGLHHGQSHRDSHASEDGFGRQHAKHDAAADNAGHGHSQRELHASERAAAATQPDRKDASPANDTGFGPSPHEAAGNGHASTGRGAGVSDHATGRTDQPNKIAASDFGDSFHFRNDVAAARPSDVLEHHGHHGPRSSEHGPPVTAQDGPASIHEAGLLGPPHTEQSDVGQARGAAHHFTHDLLV